MKQKIKIEEKKASQYVKRELKKRLTVVKIIFSIVVLGLGIVSLATRVYFLFPMALALFGLVFLYVRVLFKGDLEAFTRAFQFEITDECVSRSLDLSKLSMMQKIRVERAKSKYGENFNQHIKMSEIKSVAIKESEIEIRSTYTNPINGNGIIVIPEEVEDFSLIKNHFSPYINKQNN